jgi:Flp pilus assembly protein TadB
MEPYIIILALIALLTLFRLRMTFRRARKFDRTNEIQTKLADLRKKRDEDGE